MKKEGDLNGGVEVLELVDLVLELKHSLLLANTELLSGVAGPRLPRSKS